MKKFPLIWCFLLKKYYVYSMSHHQYAWNLSRICETEYLQWLSKADSHVWYARLFFSMSRAFSLVRYRCSCTGRGWTCTLVTEYTMSSAFSLVHINSVLYKYSILYYHIISYFWPFCSEVTWKGMEFVLRYLYSYPTLYSLCSLYTMTE